MDESLVPKGVHTQLASLAAASPRVIIGGEPGPGRTALLTTLTAALPKSERIIQIVVGDKLRLDQPNVSTLSERPQYSVARAVDDVGRMAGNRLIIGEIGDGAAARALALSRCPTLTTLRAASLGDAGNRMALMLGFGAEISTDSVRHTCHNPPHSLPVSGLTATPMPHLFCSMQPVIYLSDEKLARELNQCQHPSPPIGAGDLILLELAVPNLPNGHRLCRGMPFTTERNCIAELLTAVGGFANKLNF